MCNLVLKTTHKDSLDTDNYQCWVKQHRVLKYQKIGKFSVTFLILRLVLQNKVLNVINSVLYLLTNKYANFAKKQPPKKYSSRYSHPLRLGTHPPKVLSFYILNFRFFGRKVRLDRTENWSNNREKITILPAKIAASISIQFAKQKFSSGIPFLKIQKSKKTQNYF